MIEHNVTLNQTVRFMYAQNRIALENLGVGAYDELERGFGGRLLQNIVRIQQAGPLGRRAYLNSRIAWSQLDLDLRPNTEAQTITNYRNFAGYSGVMTSEFYRRPTFVQNPRRAEVGLNLAF